VSIIFVLFCKVVGGRGLDFSADIRRFDFSGRFGCLAVVAEAPAAYDMPSQLAPMTIPTLPEKPLYLRCFVGNFRKYARNAHKYN
jgi:hypothetical protein